MPSRIRPKRLAIFFHGWGIKCDHNQCNMSKTSPGFGKRAEDRNARLRVEGDRPPERFGSLWSGFHAFFGLTSLPSKKQTPTVFPNPPLLWHGRHHEKWGSVSPVPMFFLVIKLGHVVSWFSPWYCWCFRNVEPTSWAMNKILGCLGYSLGISMKSVVNKWGIFTYLGFV